MISIVLHITQAISPTHLTIISVFCIVISFGSFVFYKINTIRLKESKIELEHIIEERTAALKQKEQEVADSIRYALSIPLSIIPTADKVKLIDWKGNQEQVDDVLVFGIKI
jgi:hypothetical protein